jgi:hypothetical protein
MISDNKRTLERASSEILQKDDRIFEKKEIEPLTKDKMMDVGKMATKQYPEALRRRSSSFDVHPAGIVYLALPLMYSQRVDRRRLYFIEKILSQC